MRYRSLPILIPGLFLVSAALTRRLEEPPQSGESYFVITGTYPSHSEAQDSAASQGGWVLDTDLYSSLTPNLFAIVRGPFSTLQEAEQMATQLRRSARYRDAYTRNAGEPSEALAALAGDLPPVLLAALLGEVYIDVTEEVGGQHPCEPQEPYKAISLTFASIARVYDERENRSSFAAVRRELDFGSLGLITRTGVVHRMRICAE